MRVGIATDHDGFGLQRYGKVVPEVARVGVRNVFSNIASPIRIVNCVLQAKFVGAIKELGRFAVNTVWGIGGLMDLASDNAVNLPKQDADFGQTMGVYGLGQGFYIHWPILSVFHFTRLSEFWGPPLLAVPPLVVVGQHARMADGDEREQAFCTTKHSSKSVE